MNSLEKEFKHHSRKLKAIESNYTLSNTIGNGEMSVGLDKEFQRKKSVNFEVSGHKDVKGGQYVKVAKWLPTSSSFSDPKNQMTLSKKKSHLT